MDEEEEAVRRAWALALVDLVAYVLILVAAQARRAQTRARAHAHPLNLCVSHPPTHPASGRARPD